MSDTVVSVLVFVIAGGHVVLFVMAWWWAATSRHLGFLGLIVPAAVAWALAGSPLVRILTYGTAPLRPPRTGLQAAGFAATLLGFGAFFVCAVGTLLTLVVLAWAAPRSRSARA